MALYLEDFFQGDTVRLKVDYPIGTDLTGYVHIFTLKRDSGDEEPVLQVESTFGDHTADSAGDEETRPEAYVEASPTATDAVPTGKYLYTFKVIAPNGDEVTLIPKAKDYKDKVFVAPKLAKET